MAWLEIREVLTSIRALCDVVPVTVDIHDKALAMVEHFSVSFYDSLILAAAQEAGCRIVYSEDMQYRQRFGNVTVRNPF